MTTTTGTSTTSTSAAAAAAAAGLNDKIQQRAKASLFRKIITYYATYQPQDVLLGRGWIANHVGNQDENDNGNDEDMVEVDKNNNTPPPPAGGDDYDDDEKENHNKQQQQQNNANKDELPKIVGRLTDQVEIVQPPSGLSVLLLRPVCVGPLLFTKEKHRRVPSPNTELTEFSFVCHVLFLKRFACSIDCPILLQVYKYIV